MRTVELARDLIRHGADVFGVMSEAATEIIHSYTLHYATTAKLIAAVRAEFPKSELAIVGFKVDGELEPAFEDAE